MILGQVYRLAMLLAMTCGCNAVFSIDVVDAVPRSCGPYHAPVALTFTAIASPTDLSLETDGVHGLVRASVGTTTQILPIIQTAPDTFAVDATRMKNLATLQGGNNPILGAHVASVPNHTIPNGLVDPNNLGDLFAEVRTISTDSEVEHYHFSKTIGWVLAETRPVDSSPTETIAPGNELEINAGTATSFTRYLTVIRVDDDSQVHSVDLDQLLPGDQTWQVVVVSHIPVTAQINSVHSVTRAVIASGTLVGDTAVTHPLTLVYSATLLSSPGGTTQIYASAKTASGFPIGTPVAIAAAPGEMLEPWVNNDCTNLWFRQGDTVYRASSL